jgi:uncharacterized protein (DUF305 family)
MSCAACGRRAEAAFLALAILLASCGTDGGDAQGADQGENPAHGDHRAQGMNHAEKHKPGDMKGMDHGSRGMASGMQTKNGNYPDERFIDAMVSHHQGAVKMARVAVEHAEHPEIKRLAERIVSDQRAEIDELENIKKEEYGTSKVPSQMSLGQMKGMGMMMDPQSLADEKPFDKAFIDNMIPHHQSAIEMAVVARAETDNPKLENLATGIVGAQKHEISQMKHWREQWYRSG